MTIASPLVDAHRLNLNMQDRKSLRQLMLQRCHQLSSFTRINAAKRAASYLSQHLIFKSSQHIACYAAKSTEIDTQYLIHSIWQQDKFCYLPIMSASFSKILQFVPFNKDSEVTVNRYGIAEPHFISEAVIDLTKLDLVIVPLLAFDRQGHRLGSGGGYYDHTFANFKIKPILCGFAYSIQEVKEITAEEWDIPLQMVVTEQEIINCRPNA